MAYTFSGPSARAAIASDSAESMPPERPSTARLRPAPSTTSRSRSHLGLEDRRQPLAVAQQVHAVERAAGGPHLAQRPLAVAGLHVDRGDRVAQHGGLEAGRDRVERGGAHAVVGGEAGHHHVGDAALAQAVGEVGAVEVGVLLAVGVASLVLDDVEAHAGDRRVQLGAGRAGHAVRRPRAALLAERDVVGAGACRASRPRAGAGGGLGDRRAPAGRRRRPPARRRGRSRSARRRRSGRLSDGRSRAELASQGVDGRRVPWAAAVAGSRSARTALGQQRPARRRRGRGSRPATAGRRRGGPRAAPAASSGSPVRRLVDQADHVARGGAEHLVAAGQGRPCAPQRFMTGRPALSTSL